MYGLAAWRVAPYCSPRERAALAWAEPLTRISDQFPSDELYEELRRRLDEKEAVDRCGERCDAALERDRQHSLSRATSSPARSSA